MDHTPVAISRLAGDDIEGLDNPFRTSEAQAQANTVGSGDAAASISLLPAEILMQIFSYIHPTAPVHAGSVMLACRYWNALVLRTPMFWANLAGSVWILDGISICVHPERLAALKFAVAQSGTLPLDLRRF